MKRKIALLGSTGSIGTQTLQVVEEHPDNFEVYCLTGYNNIELLAEQARKFKPDSVITANESKYEALKALLADCPDVKVYAGIEAVCEVVESSAIDTVVASMVGFAGLAPTIRAIKAGKRICLANKETLVVAGQLILSLAAQYHSEILPVDSEHSAIFQSLAGEAHSEISRIILTASGGPFRKMSADELANVTKADALKHPTWNMGAKITIDSATMMNKGFEMIEAKWLFGVEPEKIQIHIHPQSIIHSAVEFVDGAVIAQLGVPDMRLPIQYALSYPKRMSLSGKRLNLFEKPLEFFEPDMEKFRCLALAYDAIHKGGNMPCIMNAANEIVNRGFLEDRCSFPKIAETIEKTMQRVSFIANPTYDDYMATDREARVVAKEIMN